ncbi:uncharacterized protein J7T54_008041 [Emericellopsis cladophorae]|uniref:Uncharacterized protein n=1 Tax=Emericellopsis cladophorae TaxID=2686198 RepID=A0A9P9Y7I0_9HYPO|nr:uncharacterized protein J7T54_008041 [Emericellopsis cladophorae]KAI6784947.1 hypothetical protein J7T54_008041 [Emericellopsis cladophorae]
MVKTDPSVQETYYHGDLSGQTEDHKWQPLRFFAPLSADRTPTGVSQAVFSSSLTAAHIGGVPRPFAAGRHANWLGRLVPTTYDSPLSSAPRSAGLGGELTILLALMTFTAPVEMTCTSRAHTVFLGHNARWRYGKWLHNDKPGGWTRSVEERPRGVLVTVSLDPWNPQGSTREKLSNFEFFDSPAIRED